MRMGFVALLFGLTLCSAQNAKDEDKVTLPTSAADLARGEKLYMGSCLFCHGPAGVGGKGANLARLKLMRAATDEDMVRIIENGIPGTEMPGAQHLTRREATQVAAYVRTLGRVETRPVPGNPARGKAVYLGKGGCSACHTIQEDGALRGGLLGPDLSIIGARRSPDYLRRALLEPAAESPEGYLLVRATTASGQTTTGRLLSEDVSHLLLRDAAGKNLSFPKTQLKEIRRLPDQSMMPGYAGKFSDAELTDLIAFLVSLAEAK